MSLLQVWPRRQEVQQALVEPTSIKRSGKNKYSGGQELPARIRRKRRRNKKGPVVATTRHKVQ